MDRQAIYTAMLATGASHDEADYIANMTDEEMVQFVEDCGGDIECLPEEMQAYYLTIVS